MPPENVRSDKASRTIEWEDPGNQNIIGYNIYRKTITEKDYKKINNERILALSYTEEDQTKPNNYFYKVSAVDKYGNESILSREVFMDLKR